MNVYEARHAGREYCCNTEGSDHYKEGGVEPLDLAIAKGTIEDCCITNITKYAYRFKETRNLKDLMKASDYAHILCGVELSKTTPANTTSDKPEPWGEFDEARANRVFNCYTGTSCIYCPISYDNNSYNIPCLEFKSLKPAIVRKTMDEWEGKK